jgi:transaldolase
MSNPLHDLAALDQAVWLDSIRRSYLAPGGYLPGLIDAGELKGLTSNPSIFEKAVASGTDYDDLLAEHAGGDPREALWAIMKRDVRDACDLFLPVFDASDGRHGQVSIEVDPAKAFDTDATVNQGRELFAEIDRPNLMVKVPGTEAGLAAITTLLGDGVNVNVTLLFSVARYEAVIGAFMDGVRARLDADEPVSRLASVASFFVSRVDTKADEALGGQQLPDTVAIANARAAYGSFEERFATAEWRELADAGARVQRPLWASTSTKNPDYPDTLYVDQLAGPNTVNTMPEETIEAVRDHGDVADRISGRADAARAQLADLQSQGLDLGQITKELETEGVEKFIASFDSAVETVEQQLG